MKNWIKSRYNNLNKQGCATVLGMLATFFVALFTFKGLGSFVAMVYIPMCAFLFMELLFIVDKHYNISDEINNLKSSRGDDDQENSIS